MTRIAINAGLIIAALLTLLNVLQPKPVAASSKHEVLTQLGVSEKAAAEVLKAAQQSAAVTGVDADTQVALLVASTLDVNGNSRLTSADIQYRMPHLVREYRAKALTADSKSAVMAVVPHQARLAVNLAAELRQKSV